jgi:hypothetical protein
VAHAGRALSPGRCRYLETDASGDPDVEVHNGRVREARANERAAEFAQRFGVAGVAASDAHSDAEVGSCATVLVGPISSATDLRAALAGSLQLVVRDRSVEQARVFDRLTRRFRGQVVNPGGTPTSGPLDGETEDQAGVRRPP